MSKGRLEEERTKDIITNVDKMATEYQKKLEEQKKENLIEFLAMIVSEYKKDEDVECIYLTPYKMDGNVIIYGVTVINADAVAVEYTINSYLNDIQNAVYNRDSVIDCVGGKIVIKIDHDFNYVEHASDNYHIKNAKKLLSSEIIYIKDGYAEHYYRVAHQFDNDKSFEKYSNIIDTGITMEKVKKKAV
ncbi:MAG: hypothetical protein IK137_03020 [Bacilli bacterium]|nr:hypothetical protein [Bacilli bacterium]